MSSVPFIGISSHFLTNDELTESRVCFTQVMFVLVAEHVRRDVGVQTCCIEAKRVDYSALARKDNGYSRRPSDC